jgi:hypothetical protein
MLFHVRYDFAGFCYRVFDGHENRLAMVDPDTNIFHTRILWRYRYALFISSFSDPGVWTPAALPASSGGCVCVPLSKAVLFFS